VSERKLYPWIAVTEIMDDEYRHAVVEIALGHLRQASNDLARFAKNSMSYMTVPGFRSVDRAPVDRARDIVGEEMLLDNDVATAVICLWAEAKADLVEELRSVAESEGLHLSSPWTWEEGGEGFILSEEVEALQDLAGGIATDESAPEADHFRLAFWLSGCLSAEAGPVEQLAVVAVTDVEEQAIAPGDGEPQEDVLLRGEEKHLLREEEQHVIGTETDGVTEVEEASTYADSLDSLRRELAELFEEFQRAEQDALASAQGALTAAKNSNLRAAGERCEELRHRVYAWQAQAKPLRRIVKQALLRLRDEAEIWPDLGLELGTESALTMDLLDEQPLSHTVEAIFGDLQRLRDYDEARQEILVEVDEVRAAMKGIHSDLSHWTPDESLSERDVPHWEDESTLTLADAKQLLRAAEAKKKELEDQQVQLRQLSRNRISNQIENLQQLGYPSGKPVWNDQTLEELLASDLERFSGSELGRLEEALVARVEERAVAVSSPEPQELAAELQREWDHAKLVELLECLAKDKRDVQTFLLIMGATAAVPCSEPIRLERSVVSSLLRGVGRLSRKTYPFQLLSALASDLLDGWQPVDVHSEAELRLVFLAANYAGVGLPDGFLWRFAQGEWNWPIEEMRGWNSVWQTALQGGKPSVSDEAEEEQLSDILDEARSRVDQTFAREGGRYVRLNSIRNPHYANMLRSEVMPWLQEQVNTLRALELDLPDSDWDHRSQVVKRLESFFVGELATKLEHESLEEMYEAAILNAGIHDAESFHRETALRVMEDCADSILIYGRSLLDLWRTKMEHRGAISRQELQAELECIPDLSALGQAALDTIIQASRSRSEYREASTPPSAEDQLVKQLLSQSVFASSMPHVVGYLTGAPLVWAELLGSLLDDIAQALDPEQAARELLEYEAPDHVLLLKDRVAGNIKEQARTLRGDKKRELNEIEERILEIGGNVEGLREDRELGRWALAYRRSMRRLKEAQVAYEADRAAKQEKAREAMQAILELQMDLFGLRDVIAPEVHQVLDDGLSLARGAIRREKWFDQVHDYVDEIRFLQEHETWPLSTVEEAYRRLERSVKEEAYERPPVTAEEVLLSLEEGDLERLHLSGLAHSMVDTRANLLHNWLEVRELSGFRGEDLKRVERNKIKSLFRYFARMVVMDYGLDQYGNHIAYEDPVVFSHWRLRYHKVDALKTNCVFVALPGNPPKSRDINGLHSILKKKGWLEVFYVFLFVPGIQPELRGRLVASYHRQGLVILDEKAVMDMVLAEGEASKPLWRLRPVMLKSIGKAEGVFQTTNSIDLMSGIFAGRREVIRQIAFSPSDYALYGGRRIGKSSVLKEVKRQLGRSQEVTAVYIDYEGKKPLTDEHAASIVAKELAREVELDRNVRGVDDLEDRLREYLDNEPDRKLVLLIDEIDYYIAANSRRHVLIESLRALSERYSSRFRVIIAGFMKLYDCMLGRGGHYSPSSDPWSRMLDKSISPLPNLSVESAKTIVDEGFKGILGWRYGTHKVPQLIVEHTGGHPSFVQYFCGKVQARVSARGDGVIVPGDIEAVFEDGHPRNSFIAHVRNTLKMNLEDRIGQFLIPWLAHEFGDSPGFTKTQVLDIAGATIDAPISDEELSHILDRLVVTSVIEENVTGMYEFSVPDYPLILKRLGDTAHLNELENEMKKDLKARK
jgi:hypothetical protein